MEKIQLTVLGTDQVDVCDLPRAVAPVFKAIQLVKRLHIAGFFRKGQSNGKSSARQTRWI